tara:strand:+ start:2774 stop:3199 length:426 start_codon:yes stop_codon:yes gene_type:complete
MSTKTIFDCVAESKTMDELSGWLKTTIGLNQELTKAFRERAWALHEQTDVLNPRIPDVSRQFSDHAAKKDIPALRALQKKACESRNAYVKHSMFFDLLTKKSTDPIATIMLSQYTSYLQGGAAESLTLIHRIRDQINKPKL